MGKDLAYATRILRQGGVLLLSVLMLAVGIIVGMVLLAFLKSRRLNLAWKIALPFIVPSIMVVISIYLIAVNWTTFVHPPIVDSWNSLQSALINNPADEMVILFGIFFGLIGILSYVIRVPFANWQQVKLFGLFEATRLKEEAKDQFEAFRKLEWDRMTAVGAMASELGMRAVQERMNGLELDAESALTTFRESIMSCYDTDQLQTSISSGQTERLRVIQVNLPHLVKEALSMPRVAPVRGNWDSAIAVPVHFGDTSYTVWFHATNYTFTETDAAFVEAMANVLQSNFERALIVEHIEEVGATDKP